MSESPADNQERKAPIGFVLLVLLIDILSIGIVIPVLPELVKQLVADSEMSAEQLASTTAFYVGLIGSCYALTQFICAPIVGSISDAVGRRPILLASMIGLAVDYVIQGMAPSITWLFVGRVIAGVFGASISTANAYVADISTDENRAKHFGLIGAMFGIGFTIGPVMGGLLGGVNLRLPFFVAAGLAFANFVYGFLSLPESHQANHRTRFDLRRANPMVSVYQLRKFAVIPAIATALFLGSLAQRGLENVWVIYTGYRYGWDEKLNGWVLGLVGIMAIIVQGGVAGRAIPKIGARTVAVYAPFLAAITFVGYGLAPIGWMIPAIIVVGSFAGLGNPALQSIVGKIVPSQDQGKVQGAFTSLISLTSCIAPMFFTTFIFRYFTSPSAPIQLPGAPFLVGSVLLVASGFVLATFLPTNIGEDDKRADESS